MMMPLFILWALAGWCGTVPLIFWFPSPPSVPERPPRPNWLLPRIIGVVSGIVGGWLFTKAFAFGQGVPWMEAGPHPEPWLRIVFAAATAVGAFIAARVVTDVYGQLSNRG